MRLDPVGCGARGVRDCLLIQLEVANCQDRLAVTLISDHLQDMQPHKLSQLAKAIGTTVEAIAAELEFIRTLDPYPGRRYSNDDAIMITPEVFIEKLDEDYVIYFADDGTARLRISQSYQEMLKKRRNQQRGSRLH
ncbi:MAG: hypothetical protein WKF84_05380 [Pyrinomonadaceae bacterium]